MGESKRFATVATAAYPCGVAGVDIRLVRYDALVAQALVADAMAELGERYEDGEGDATAVSPTEFQPPDGAFLVAYLDGEAVGCGGWRSRGDDGTVAELKRMYTVRSARGRGVGRRMLKAVEDSARAHGRTRIVLECGVRQPEAIELYESCGYYRIDNFGYYRDHPEVVSLGRDL
jgi:GNAT superfamily N-acetyltransferase